MEPVPPGPPPPAAAGVPKQHKQPLKRSKTEKTGKTTLGTQESHTISSLKNKYISKSLPSRAAKENRNGTEYQVEPVGPNQQNGIMKTKEGRVFYGTFQNYMPHGRGILERLIGPEKGYIDGEWTNGKLSGPITIYSPLGHIYSGFWENEHWQENKAKLTLKNGDVYEGTFSKELNKQLDKEGRGVLTSKTKVYQGIWRNNKFSEGKITFLNDPELKEYEGQVKSDAFNGKGVLTYKDGRRIEGNFIDGICSEGKFSRVLENGQVTDEYQGKLTHHFPPHLVPPPPAAAPPQPAAEPKKRKKSSKESSPSPVSKAPTLPPLSEIVRTIPGYRVHRHYEDARIIYDGEMANNKLDGMGTLHFKNTGMLDDLGIPDFPRFTGLFLDGIAMEGYGVQELVPFDNIPRLSYGIFKGGRLYTGVGFVLTEQGIYCGVFQEGRHVKGVSSPLHGRVPTTQQVFLDYLFDALAIYQQLRQNRMDG